MTPRKSRRVWALSLALAVSGWAAQDARADAMTYGTIGWVDTPNGGTPTGIRFDGTTGTVTETGSLNLGQFVVTSAAETGPKVDYTGDAFHILAYSGDKQQSELITGTFTGSVGATATGPLTATVNTVQVYGGQLPFTLSLTPGTAMPLSSTAGSKSDSPTILSAPVTVSASQSIQTPEPSSVAVFGAALGGLALWRRRAAR
ncbi:MAG: PEP-CTERM sorting domain-containing protein [Planctomycetia bacterium]|nr:PEP-CTERM sorting domain-containing protein [Planctomycetia bacterium]